MSKKLTTAEEAEAKSINIPGIGRLPFMDNDHKNFYKYSTILYGASGSGKTTVLMHLLKILQPYIPSIIVISPTSNANNAYKGIVPDNMVITDISPVYLRNVLDRQKISTQFYNTANDMNNLQSVFGKCKNGDAEKLIITIRNYARQKITELEASDLDYANKREHKDKIVDTTTAQIKNIFKKVIRENRSKLLAKKIELSKEELTTVKYLDFNPATLLILDDCASQIDKWGKDPVMNEFFFEGRHYNITSIYTMQNDKSLPTGIRKNTFISIFTDSGSATSFFENKANAIMSSTKKMAIKVIDHLFATNIDGKPNFKKMVYARLDPKYLLRYVIADIPRDFKFGSKPFWEFCNKLPKNGESTTGIDENNKFYSAFSV